MTAARALMALHKCLPAVAAVVVATASSTAHADCQPSSPVNGDTETCSGTDTNGVNDPTVDNLTVNEVGGAVLTTRSFGIRVGNNAVVSNAGEIDSANRGIDAGGGSIVTNSGSITTDSDGIAIRGSTGTVFNSGTITARSDGIFLGGSGSASNSGTITANNDGMVITGDGTIVNSGTITARSDGLFLGGTGTITNSGMITSDRVGVRFDSDDATLVNIGAISGGTAGVRFSRSGNSSSFVINDGAIFGGSFGVQVMSGSATVVNRSSISSDGTAVRLDGTGVNIVENAGTIAGGTLGIRMGGSSPSIVNNGLITGPIALLLTRPGMVTNNGTIDGQVDMSNGAGNLLTNNGRITITAPGVGATHLVNGTFTQGAGGTLVIRVDATGGHDILSVTGAANLGGTLRARLQPGHYADTQTYTGVVLGPLSGTFTNLTTSSEFLTATVAYVGGTRVDLTLARTHFDMVPGETENERAFARALERAYESNAPSGVTVQAETLEDDLLEAGSLRMLDEVDGEIGTAVQNPSFTMGEQFAGALFTQLQRWRRPGSGGAVQGQSAYRVQVAAAAPMFGVAQAASDAGTWPPVAVGPRWNAWLSGFGLSGSRDGDATVGSARLSYRTGGGAAGADFELAPNLLFGAAIGASGADFTLDGADSSGTARTFFVGLYGSWTMGPLYVDAAASYGHAQFTTNRLIAIPDLTERATGEFGGNQVGGRFEVGWRFPVQRFELTPFAGVSVQALRQAAYDENSIDVTINRAGIAGLSYDAQTSTSVRSFLGGQAAATFVLGERTSVTPSVRLAWAHEFTTTRQINASFLSIPGAAFTEQGARPVRDAMIVSAGLEIGIGRNAALYAQFDGDLGGGGNAYAGSGGLRFIW